MTIAELVPITHSFFHYPREGRHGGGVGVAISKAFKSVKSFNRKCNSFECMELDIVHSKKKIGIFVIYRPPDSNTTQFFDDFESFVLESETALESNVYVGDFNLWMNVPDDPIAMKMKKMLEIFNIKNFVNDPTHKSGKNT